MNTMFPSSFENIFGGRCANIFPASRYSMIAVSMCDDCAWDRSSRIYIKVTGLAVYSILTVIEHAKDCDSLRVRMVPGDRLQHQYSRRTGVTGAFLRF